MENMAVDDVMVAGWMVDEFGIFASLHWIVDMIPASMGCGRKRLCVCFQQVVHDGKCVGKISRLDR